MKIEELLWEFHYELNASQKIFINNKAKLKYARRWLDGKTKV